MHTQNPNTKHGSGNVNCDEVRMCNIKGFCNGAFVKVVKEDSEFHCLAKCKNLESCKFYAFKEETGLCTLLKDCSSVRDCQNCYSGMTNCTIGKFCYFFILCHKNE